MPGEANAGTKMQSSDATVSAHGGSDHGKEDQDYKPHGIPSRQAIKPEKNQNDRRAKRYSGLACETTSRRVDSV